MLSRNAFNALLKTLEEPPDTVKFIFATTEIRKVPVTILSRCQRFDLRRVPTEMLTEHLTTISNAENLSAEHQALAQIARAAEGSVRDALSLLDQAAAQGAEKITEQAVVDMLGHAGQEKIAALLSACLNGQTKEALALYDIADKGGAEAEAIISDMLEIIHLASLTAAGAPPADQPEALKKRLDDLSKIGIARLGRAWQLILSGHSDVRAAPNPRAAAQMALIKLAHIAPMPTPAEILRKLPDSQPQIVSISAEKALANDGKPEPVAPEHETPASTSSVLQAPPSRLRENHALSPLTTHGSTTNKLKNLRDIADRCETKGEHILAARIRNYLRPVSLSPGKLEAELAAGLPDDVQENLLSTIARHLSLWTEQPWLVSRAYEGGGKTVEEEDNEKQQTAFRAAAQIPLVNAVLNKFADAEITNITSTDGIMEPQPESMSEGSEK